MADDLKIKVSTPGARRAKKDLREVADAERKVGRAGKRAGEESGESLKKSGGVIQRLTGQLKGLLAGYLGLAGAKAVLGMLRQEMEKVDDVTRRAIESMRAVMALSALRGERQEVQAAVRKMAGIAGRPLEQVAPAYYTLLGGTAGMDMARRNALMQQSLLFAKTDPRANLESIVGLFSTIGTQQPEMSPQQIGNLVSRTIEQAKSTPEEMAAYLPSILTTAQAGGAEISTAAAMFSFATRMGGGVAQSGTAVRAAMLGLLTPSPEIAGQLKGYGFQPGAGLMDKIGWLAARGGDLPPELIAGLGGRRGLEAIAAISQQPGVFGAEVVGMDVALKTKGSLIQERLRSMYGEMPEQRALDQANQIDVLMEQEFISDEGEALQARARADLMLFLMKKQGAGALARWGVEATGWALRQAGADWSRSAHPKFRAMQDLLDEGYSAADIAEHLAKELPDYKVRLLGKLGTAVDMDRYRGILEKAGVEPMQGRTAIIQQQNIGCYHNHQNERRDAAGRPVVPMAP